MAVVLSTIMTLLPLKCYVYRSWITWCSKFGIATWKWMLVKLYKVFLKFQNELTKIKVEEINQLSWVFNSQTAKDCNHKWNPSQPPVYDEDNFHYIQCSMCSLWRTLVLWVNDRIIDACQRLLWQDAGKDFSSGFHKINNILFCWRGRIYSDFTYRAKSLGNH